MLIHIIDIFRYHLNIKKAIRTRLYNNQHNNRFLIMINLLNWNLLYLIFFDDILLYFRVTILCLMIIIK